MSYEPKESAKERDKSKKAENSHCGNFEAMGWDKDALKDDDI